MINIAILFTMLIAAIAASPKGFVRLLNRPFEIDVTLCLIRDGKPTRRIVV